MTVAGGTIVVGVVWVDLHTFLVYKEQTGLRNSVHQM